MNINVNDARCDSSLQSQRIRQRAASREALHGKFERIPRYTVVRRHLRAAPGGQTPSQKGRKRALVAQYFEKTLVTLAVLLIVGVYASSLLRLGGLL